MSAASLKIRVPLHLKPREQQVLAGIAEGLCTKQIAGRLRLAVHTVQWHRMKLMRRTDLQNDVQLTKLALRLGMTTIDV